VPAGAESLASSKNITKKRAGYSNYRAQGCLKKLKAAYQSSRLFFNYHGCLFAENKSGFSWR